MKAQKTVIAFSELRVCLSARFAHNYLLIAAEEDCPKAAETYGNKLHEFILGVVNNSFVIP